MRPEVPENLARLERLAELLSDAPLVDRTLDETRRHIVRVAREYLIPRMAGSDTSLVVAVTGADGVGKSHLVNTLIEVRHTIEGVVRPTTTAPVVIVSTDPGDGWPDLERRLRAAAPVVAIRRDAGAAANLLVILDLPALSADAAAVRLLDLADLVIVVATPERYADRSTWALIRGLDDGGWTTWIALNRVEGPHDEVFADLERLLEERRIGAPVFPLGVSGATELRSRLIDTGGPGRAAFLQESVDRRSAHVMRAAASICDPLEELERDARRLRAIVDAEYARAAEEARTLVDPGSLGPGAGEEPWSAIADRLAGVLTHRVGAAAGRTATGWAHTETGRMLLEDEGETLWRHSADATIDTRARLLGWESDVAEIVMRTLRRRPSQAKVDRVTAAVMRAAVSGQGKLPWRIRRRLRGSVDSVVEEAAARLAAISFEIVGDDGMRFIDRLGATLAPGVVDELRRIVADAGVPARPAKPTTSAETADA